MAVPGRDSKIRYTTYVNSKNKNSKKPFHKPEAYGDLIRISLTPPLKILSVSSIVLQAAFTVLAISAASSADPVAALEDSGFSSSLLYLLFPAITWIITIGFRFMCRVLPIDMWRLPSRAKRGILFCGGRPLKLATLLLELVVTAMFICITLVLAAGNSPGIWIPVVFAVILAASVYFPGRYAYRTMLSASPDQKNPKNQKRRVST